MLLDQNTAVRWGVPDFFFFQSVASGDIYEINRLTKLTITKQYSDEVAGIKDMSVFANAKDYRVMNLTLSTFGMSTENLKFSDDFKEQGNWRFRFCYGMNLFKKNETGDYFSGRGDLKGFECDVRENQLALLINFTATTFFISDPVPLNDEDMVVARMTARLTGKELNLGLFHLEEIARRIQEIERIYGKNQE